MRVATLVITIASLLLLVACGEDDDSPTSDTAQDVVGAEETLADTAAPDTLADTTEPLPDTSDEVAGEIADETVAEVADEVAEEITEPTWPPFDPTVCGMDSYEWLPPSDVGGVVIWDEMGMSNLDPATIDTLLAQAGYEALSPVSYSVRNFELRYVTQDKGELVEATAAVGFPLDYDGGPAPIALWLHGTTGFSDDCAPTGDLLMSFVAPSLLASLGYITVAPDYIGMVGFGDPSPEGTIHPYLVGEPTAIASLDAVRAALTAMADEADAPEADTSKVVLWGGSQGGHAAFFTDIYAPHYAPELEVAATVAAIPPTDLLGQATYALSDFMPGAANTASMIMGSWAWYGMPEDVSGVFTDDDPYNFATNLPEYYTHSCDEQFDNALDGINALDQVFLQSFLDEVSDGEWPDPWQCYLTVNSVHTTPVPRIKDVPVLTPYAELDELVKMHIERPNVELLCDQGWRIEYLECAGAGHVDGALSALPYMHAWVQDRLAGVPWNEDDICVITDPVDCEALLD